MRRSIAALLASLLALFSQSAGATNYHIYRKFELCHDKLPKQCSRHRCAFADLDLRLAMSSPCQGSLGARISGARAFDGWIDPGSDRQSAPSMVVRVAQADTAKPNVPPQPSANKNASAPSSAATAKWQKALVDHLARYKRYPAQGNTPEGVASVAFTIDRKGNVLSSRIEKTSGSDVLDAEALTMIKRAAPFPPPPAEVAADELTLVLPVRFAAGEKR